MSITYLEAALSYIVYSRRHRLVSSYSHYVDTRLRFNTFMRPIVCEEHIERSKSEVQQENQCKSKFSR